MGQILRHWRIPTATLFAAVIIAGAYLLARDVKLPTTMQASAEASLLQAIAAKDTDGDGLTDWEEALYGTDSNIIDTFKLGMTDGEAVAKGLLVPKAIADITNVTSAPVTGSGIDYAAQGLTAPVESTLVDAFAKNFFTLYVAAKQANGGVELSATDVQRIQEQALNSLTTTVTSAPEFKSPSDLTISASGAAALKTFAADAEAVFAKNRTDATMGEIQYLTAAVENNDATALLHITSIAKSNRDSAVGIAKLPVPKELAAADLLLINALMHISEIISDFARVDTDPLAALLALQQYSQATRDLALAFTAIGTAYAAAGVVLPAGTPGASFVNLVNNLSAQQTATTP